MQNAKPILLFFGLLLAGMVITAVIASTMDARLIDQEQQREDKQSYEPRQDRGPQF